MAISSQVLEIDRKRGNKDSNLSLLSKSKPLIWNFLSGMVLLVVLGIFVRVGFSALVVNNQRNLDRTITMISDASDVNRAHRFNISELESAQRIYKIAFGSPEELVENNLHGLGMISPSEIKYLTATTRISSQEWGNATISKVGSSVDG